MLLYHVTSDLNHSGIFVPKLPESIEQYDEDNQTNRICVSDSIEGCLTSMPNGGEDLDNLLDYSDNKLKLFIFDTDKLNIDNSDIILPETLVSNYGVIDAVVTGEHWLLKPVTETDFIIISVLRHSIELMKLGNIVTGKVIDFEYKTLYKSSEDTQSNGFLKL